MKISIGSFIYTNYRPFVFVIVLLAIAIVPIVTQQSKAQVRIAGDSNDIIGPIVSQAVAFAETGPARDLPPADPDSEEYRKFAGLLPEMPKWNKDMINPIIPGYGANAPEFSANPFVDPLLENNRPDAPPGHADAQPCF